MTRKITILRTSTIAQGVLFENVQIGNGSAEQRWFNKNLPEAHYENRRGKAKLKKTNLEPKKQML